MSFMFNHFYIKNEEPGILTVATSEYLNFKIETTKQATQIKLPYTCLKANCICLRLKNRNEVNVTMAFEDI